MSLPEDNANLQRRLHLLALLQGLSLETALAEETLRKHLEAEAAASAAGDSEALITPAALAQACAQIARLKETRVQRILALPCSIVRREIVVIVPGCLASTLANAAEPGRGTIWIDPVAMASGRLSALQLAPFDGGEVDLDPTVRIEPTGGVPLLYDFLKLALEAARYPTEIFPFDWRKDLDLAARLLVVRLRGLASRGLAIHIVAHSQGALVARRALQLLGAAEPRGSVQNLVLLGPANFGSFSAALALGGGHSWLGLLNRLGGGLARGLAPVLASMSGLYQLLPFDRERAPALAELELGSPRWWPVPIDAQRLERFYAWARSIDTAFFNDRTTIILGGDASALTTGGVCCIPPLLQDSPEHALPGDGTVAHSCAVLPGVKTYCAPDARHPTMATDPRVIEAVLAILRNQPVALASSSSDPADYLPPRWQPAAVQPEEAALPMLAHERQGTFLPPYDADENPPAPADPPECPSGSPLPGKRTYLSSTASSARWPGVAYELILDACELLPFEFLRTGDRLGRAVLKIQCQDGAVGTGFLVAPGVLLTNHHVLPDLATATGSYALANYETSPPSDASGRPAVAPLEPQTLFVTNHDLDFTFCAVSGLDFLGTIPVERNSLNVSVLEYVNIIQHPRGRPKEVALQDNRVVKADNVVVQYACDTEPGSSGSPVFNNRWRLVALHHASVVTESPEGRFAADADANARYLNEGIRLSAIATWLETASADTQELHEQVTRLRQIFHGHDPQTGFFGALGRKPRGKTAAEVVVNSYKANADDLDLAYWNLARLNRRFREHLPDVGRVIAEMGLDVWCFSHAGPVSIRAICDHLETNYQQSYEALIEDETAPATSAVLFRAGPGVAVERLPWASGPKVPPLRVRVRSTRHRGALDEFTLVILPEADEADSSKPLLEPIRSELLRTSPPEDWILVGAPDVLLCRDDLGTLLGTGAPLFAATAEHDGAVVFLAGLESRTAQIFVSPNLSPALGEPGLLIVASDRALPQSITMLNPPHPVAFRLSLGEAHPHAIAAVEPPVPAGEPGPAPPETVDPLEQKIKAMLEPLIARLLSELKGSS